MVAKPTISKVSPNSGKAGTTAKIVGTGFGATQGNSTVTVDGVAVTPTEWSDTAITIAIPHATVLNPASEVIEVHVGGNSSSPVQFSVTK
jgi:hypothetical protein